MQNGFDGYTGISPTLNGFGVGDFMQVRTLDEHGFLTSQRQDQRRHLHSVVTKGPHKAFRLHDGLPSLDREDTVFKGRGEPKLSEKSRGAMRPIGLLERCMLCTNDASSCPDGQQRCKWGNQIVCMLEVHLNG